MWECAPDRCVCCCLQCADLSPSPSAVDAPSPVTDAATRKRTALETRSEHSGVAEEGRRGATEISPPAPDRRSAWLRGAALPHTHHHAALSAHVWPQLYEVDVV